MKGAAGVVASSPRTRAVVARVPLGPYSHASASFEANNRKGVHMSENKTYEAPALRELGSVEELTQGSILTGNPDGGLFITVSV